MRPRVSPAYGHLCGRCVCLGYATINDTTADLFVCGDLIIARFSDDPGDYEAVHLHSIDAQADVFLLTAFRLYLEKKEKKAPGSEDASGGANRLQS